MRHLSFTYLLLLSMFVTACGNGPTGPSPFTQTINGSLTSFAYTSHTLTTSRSGTLTVSLSWTAAADRDLDLYLTDANCQDIYDPLEQCALLEESIASAGSTETVSRVVQQGAAYKIWVDSFSFTNHSYSLAITIQ